MVDPKKMSIDDILAACRGGGGPSEGGAGDKPAAGKAKGAKPQPSPEASADAPVTKGKSSEPPKKGGETGKGVKPGNMSVADILAAARGGGTGETASGAEKPAAEKGGAKAAGAKAPVKPGSMSVADILAAARQGGGTPAADEPAQPAAKAAPKPAAAKPAAAEATPAASGPKDTSSILAAARKAVKPGPMSKEEAKQRSVPLPEKPEKALPVRPEKPAYATPKAAPTSSDRRGFFSVLMGSFMAIGFSSFTLTNLVWGLGLARFMFPNVLTEPPSKFKVGFPADFSPDAVSDNFKAQFGVWVVNTIYEGQRQIFALRTVCTHLGCTPNWLEAEQKFKCPCHGSGFYKDGVNFEGPAPRPLERYAIQLADDGQLEIDKSRVFHWELGEWSDGTSYVPV